MTRTILCCLSLAFCFTLTCLHQESIAHASDVLPIGSCKFYSKNPFGPRESDKFILPIADFVSASSPASKSNSTSDSNSATKSDSAPLLMTYVPRTTRTWDFNYEPIAATTKPASKRVVLRWRTQGIKFRVKPAVTFPVRSLKKHTAPVLFWGSGTVSNMTITANFISRQLGEILQSSFSPINQLPFRIVRTARNCLGLR